MLLIVSEAGCIGSEKVTVGVTAIATFVAPLAGVFAVMVRG